MQCLQRTAGKAIASSARPQRYVYWALINGADDLAVRHAESKLLCYSAMPSRAVRLNVRAEEGAAVKVMLLLALSLKDKLNMAWQLWSQPSTTVLTRFSASSLVLCQLFAGAQA